MLQTICFGITVNVVDIEEIFTIFGGQTKKVWKMSHSLPPKTTFRRLQCEYIPIYFKSVVV